MAGRFDEAVEQAKKAVEREPKNEFTYLSLADACILAGQEEEARAAAAEGLKINPEFRSNSVPIMMDIAFNHHRPSASSQAVDSR